MEHINQVIGDLISERDRLAEEVRELRKLWRFQGQRVKTMDETLLPERAAIVLRFLTGGHEWLAEGRRIVLVSVKGEGHHLVAYQVGIRSEVMRYTGAAPEKKESVLRYRLDLEQFLILLQGMTSGDVNRMLEIMEREQNDGHISAEGMAQAMGRDQA